MRAALSILVALSIAATAKATAHVGCLDETDTFPTNDCKEVSDAKNNHECVKACKAEQSKFLYSFFIGGKKTTPACYCSRKYPFTNTTVAGKANKKGKIDEKHRCDEDTFWATDLTTSFTFDNCYKDVGSPDRKCDKLVKTPQDCFDYCRWYQVAIWSFPDSSWSRKGSSLSDDDDDDGLDCYCGSDNSLTGKTEVVCPKWGDKGYYRFTHPVASHSPSQGYGKRQEAKRALFQAQKSFSPCPAGMQACLVDRADSESFECLEPQTELESCGGCTRGYFQPKSDLPLGVDCSALPGVALGGVTCKMGSCHVSRCKSSYHLINGRCAFRGKERR